MTRNKKEGKKEEERERKRKKKSPHEVSPSARRDCCGPTAPVCALRGVDGRLLRRDPETHRPVLGTGVG